MDEINFEWVNFYMEFADKLLEYKNNRKELIDKIIQSFDELERDLPKVEADEEGNKIIPIDIDPFTIFGFFNKQIKWETRTKIATKFKEIFSLKSKVPLRFDGIPVVNNLSSAFFYFKDERENEDINNLWNVFECAIKINDNNQYKTDFIYYYNQVLTQRGVRWNITMGLFWIRPKNFIALDKNNREFLKMSNLFSEELVNTIKSLRSPPEGKLYLEICENVLNKIKNSDSEYKSIPQLSFNAYKNNNKEENGIGDNDIKTKKYWLYSLGKQEMYWDTFYQSGIMAIGWEEFDNLKNFKNKKEIEKKLNEYYNDSIRHYNDANTLWQFANEIQTGDIIFAKKGTNIIVAMGVVTSDYILDKNQKIFKHKRKIDWKFKGNWKYNKSQIVQKKYNLKPSEIEILAEIYSDPKNFEDNTISLDRYDPDDQTYVITVPSYRKNSKLNFSKPTVYRAFDVFKEKGIFEAVENPYYSKTRYFTYDPEDIFSSDSNLINNDDWEDNKHQLLQKTLTDITNFKELIRDITSFFIHDIEFFEYETGLPIYTSEDFLEEAYIDEKEYNVLVNLLNNKKNLIIQGAPGVGKTFLAKRLAYSIMGVKDINRVQMVQFHQSYSYEDFIMGFRPSKENFELKQGSFYKFCKKAEDDDENDYFFIIDEINRGNLSKIFGELFMLIEKDKRGEKNKIQLLYSEESFFIPKNLYIIGLMNTADRSLAMVDYALRRRFSFFNLKPGFSSEGFKAYQENVDIENFNTLIETVVELNEEIKNDESLGEGFVIGHSYFSNIKSYEQLEFIIDYEIIPLLKEYWFDEPDKVENWTLRLKDVIN